jgi:hypothetical protein
MTMTLTRLLAATCGILALAGCGTTESSPPAGGTPPGGGTTVSDSKPATEATRPASDGVLKSPPSSDKSDVKEADGGLAAAPETPTIEEATASILPRATATERLTDQEVKALLESIENERAAFEAALDPKLKNSTIKGQRGEVKTNEFFDDLQDQVRRARDRFSSNYSASSEVLSLLQFATRLNAWASTQPAGFQGSREWGVLAIDFRRLAAAYNSALLGPAQARRLNDAELVTAAANVEKNMDAFRNAYDSALAANTNLTPASRETAIQNVDAMKNSARALHAALGKKQKGVAEANALLKGSAVMIDATFKLPPDSSAAAAWAPVREELSKVVLAYEVTPSR